MTKCINYVFNSLISGLIALGCNHDVHNIRATQGNILLSVYASGLIKAKNQYQVYSRVSGIIKEIYIAENDTVGKGSPLFQIGDESIRLNTNNAELAAAFNAIYSNEEKIKELKNNIRLAQSKFSIDSLNFCRQKYLFDHDIGSRNELEQRQLAVEISKSTLESHRHTYTTVVKQLGFAEKQAINELLITRSRENDYRITSEINGRVYAILKQKGEMVNTTIPIGIIGDAHDFIVELQVDELDVNKIKLNQKVVMTLDSYAGQTFEGIITKIYPIMDELSKTFTAEAEFITKPRIIYPLLTVNANIIVEQKKNVIIIPRNYLVNDSFVLSLSGKKRVQTGIMDYEKVEIVSGLSAKEMIKRPRK